MSTENKKAEERIIKKILNGEISDKDFLEKEKRRISKEFGLSGVPSNAEILKTAGEEKREELIPLLRKKPVRSISGVTVITVMPEPKGCPKDEPCTYCPGGPEEETPQSYTGKEPASARAKHASYDPIKQINRRKKQLRAIGHKIDKVELIIFGGTFLSQPIDYQRKFVHRCIDTISENDSPDLKTAKKRAETSDIRVIGVTFETRPDYCRQEQIDNILDFGGTRVEIGVQTLDNEIYQKINREHTVQDVIDSTQEAKDSGLAVVHHIMPGLPGSTPEKDLENFEELFKNPNFRPDMLKIYPCLVIEDTELYDMWKNGDYQPLSEEEAYELIADMKEKTPEWVRIQRIQRDIPSGEIEAGVQKGNLRAIVQRKMKREGRKCNCIRCREVGHKTRNENLNPKVENGEILTKEYEASNGKEIFISYENPEKDIIFGHLRMRMPSENAQREEIDKRTGIVRLLHVFGKLVSVGNESKSNSWQHAGIGKEMLRRGEKIVEEEYDANKISILAGIGAREYYRKLDYKLKSPYMVKKI